MILAFLITDPLDNYILLQKMDVYQLVFCHLVFHRSSCTVACMLIYIPKKRPHSKYVQRSYTKSIYKVHVYKAHPKSITYTTYPPHLHKYFVNVCTLHQIESGDFVYGWTTNVVSSVFCSPSSQLFKFQRKKYHPFLCIPIFDNF